MDLQELRMALGLGLSALEQENELPVSVKLGGGGFSTTSQEGFCLMEYVSVCNPYVDLIDAPVCPISIHHAANQLSLQAIHPHTPFATSSFCIT